MTYYFSIFQFNSPSSLISFTARVASNATLASAVKIEVKTASGRIRKYIDNNPYLF